MIVYRPHFPRIEIGEQVHAFLAESVVATIEIKSTLNRAGVAQAVKAARSTKRLRRADHRGMQVGYAPSTILNYLVAYNGPSSMRTVHTWLTAEQQDQGISSPDLPPPLTVDRDNPVLPLLAAQMEGSLRHGSPAPSLDGIFVLGKGFAILDNSRLGLVTDDLRRTNPSSKWQVGNTEQGALLLFFMSLSAAVSGHAMIEYDLTPYTHGVQFPDVGFLP
ncbi:MAG: hypothetical protein DRQ55_19085 [Planctomycetota bacterium]|nr:MAG: hypothetical protein DRQ55_19085 [Planctomycetota bacterium]